MATAVSIDPTLQQQLSEVEEAAARSGGSAVMQAARMGHHDVLALLLRTTGSSSAAGALTDGPRVGQQGRRPAFLAAANNGHEQCLRVLLASPSSLAELLSATSDAAGWNPLMLSASRGFEPCVRLLLQHNPDAQITHRAQGGFNALIPASCQGFAPCVALLLQHSPDVQVAAVLGTGETSAVLAVEGGHLSCLQLLLRHSPQQQRLDKALTHAARGWEKQLLRQHSSYAADTPEPYQRCVELLLSKGAMLTAQAPPGAFALGRTVIQDLAARALVPDMAAAAATQTTQELGGHQAAGEDLPRTRPAVTAAEVAALAQQLAAARA